MIPNQADMVEIPNIEVVDPEYRGRTGMVVGPEEDGFVVDVMLVSGDLKTAVFSTEIAEKMRVVLPDEDLPVPPCDKFDVGQFDNDNATSCPGKGHDGCARCKHLFW